MIFNIIQPSHGLLFFRDSFFVLFCEFVSRQAMMNLHLILLAAGGLQAVAGRLRVALDMVALNFQKSSCSNDLKSLYLEIQ